MVIAHSFADVLAELETDQGRVGRLHRTWRKLQQLINEWWPSLRVRNMLVRFRWQRDESDRDSWSVQLQVAGIIADTAEHVRDHAWSYQPLEDDGAIVFEIGEDLIAYERRLASWKRMLTEIVDGMRLQATHDEWDAELRADANDPEWQAPDAEIQRAHELCARFHWHISA